MIKGHEQVEKTLEMKKCRNGTAKIKKTRYRKVHNVNSHTSMLDGFYLTTQYQFKGSVATLGAMPTSFSFFLKCYRLVMIAGQSQKQKP